jgi:GntR family transcriptional regulator
MINIYSNTMTEKKLQIAPISPAAPGPLYRQIVDGVKREVSEGRLPPGTALPSFRSLAEELLVSLITVKRAYEELEREGIIFRRQGLGTFVAENGKARSREVKRLQAERLMKEAVQECREAGLAREEIEKMMLGVLDQE